METRMIAVVALIISLVALGISLKALNQYKELTQRPVANSVGEETVSLLGSGSTFVKPAMDNWIEEFTRGHPNIEIEYTGGGSGKGVSDLLSRLVDFAASDPPLPRSKWQKHQGEILQFPVALGAVVVVYNIPEIGDAQLNLTGEVIAKIYLGEIIYWDDPAIKQLNPAVADKLPHREIIAVHRSDSSGTTQIFTTFLAKTCSEWREKVGVGKSVEWPVDKTGRGIGQEGNQGVTQAIKSTPYSIGYVEWAYALEYGLPYARLQNPAGKFVAPSTESISAAFAIDNPPSPLDDWSDVAKEFVYSSASPDAYPLAGQTFLLVWRSWDDSAKCNAMKAFIEYIGSQGQDNLPRGYAPLPEQLKKVVSQAAQLLECGG
ncbi:Phosphate transport system periplasmic phosphate-binding protein [Pyrodictium delaneyi]|nr:phosphate ABC transporter substrate-binding protein PstS [Pyrodictium delaneyi]ALL01003.1 Phosphate transport system periplasmic phosphate-binding protein [Pyrodictium delaneyi]